MDKKEYYISINDYCEPWGMKIPKGSILKYLRTFNQEYMWALCFDEKENQAYPLILKKDKVKIIDSEKVKENIKSAFAEYIDLENNNMLP